MPDGAYDVLKNEANILRKIGTNNAHLDTSNDQADGAKTPLAVVQLKQIYDNAKFLMLEMEYV